MTEDPTPPEDPTPVDGLAPVGSGAHGPMAALRLQVLRQQGRLEGQAARLTCQTGQIAALAARLRDSEARIGTLIPEAQALQQEAAALRLEVAALRASTSWRITWPLRALRRTAWWLGRQARALWSRTAGAGWRKSGKSAGDAEPRG